MLVAAASALCYGLAGRRLGENDLTMVKRCGIALAIIAAWMILTGELAARGVISDFARQPPPLLIVFLVVIALGLRLGLSRVGDRLARGLPLAVLVGFQSFRFPLELVMHRAAMEGVMPPQMSYSGWNLDILTGITAIIVSILIAMGRMPRWGIWAWNIGGIVLLTGIIVLAGVSSPMIRAFGDEPARVNSWVAYFPYIWLATVHVVAAIAGHTVITRKLLRSPE